MVRWLSPLQCSFHLVRGHFRAWVSKYIFRLSTSVRRNRLKLLKGQLIALNFNRLVDKNIQSKSLIGLEIERLFKGFSILLDPQLVLRHMFRKY